MKFLIGTLFALTLTTQIHAGESAQRFYCSAATSDGYWYVHWSAYSEYDACRVVRQNLDQVTAAPIRAGDRGSIWNNFTNEVNLRCQGYSRRFVGFGLSPLYDAYNRARNLNLRHCVFRVN